MNQTFLLNQLLRSFFPRYIRFFFIKNLNSAHEYTEANARFAVSVEPSNDKLQQRYQHILKQRKAGEPTVPSNLGEEKLTNPFLRCDMSDEIRKNVGVTSNDTPADAFAKVRMAKDNF